jgi:hypothetical protein
LTSPNRLLQAARNGDRDKADHPATPVSVEELERDASACVAAGARAIHMHPRDPEGRQTLEAGAVDGAVARVREACGVPVGVTTSAEVEPDPERRLRLVRAWHEPDYASVNLSEPGAVELMEVLVGIGVGVEAGVWTVEDAERLAASGLGEGHPDPGRAGRAPARGQQRRGHQSARLGRCHPPHTGSVWAVGPEAAARRRAGRVGAAKGRPT